jgi:hypothetical protein
MVSGQLQSYSLLEYLHLRQESKHSFQNHSQSNFYFGPNI